MRSVFNRFLHCAIFAMLVLSAPAAMAADIEIDGELFEVHRVNEHVFVASQAYGSTRINFGIVVGSDQVVLVSSMMRSHAPSIEALVKKVSGKPVGVVLVIDSDPFHHSASAYFRDKGALVIGHEALGSKGIGIDVGFDSELVLDMGVERIRMRHTPAHTADHAMVTLEESQVVFTGDAFRNDWLVYAGPNGWSAQLAFLDALNANCSASTILVPGNRGRVVHSTCADLESATRIHGAFKAAVDSLSRQGLSAKEISESEAVQGVLRSLERYDEFAPHVIHHVEELLAHTGQSVEP
ncbi:MBL fold metallo-hydrolase [uncultured Arenimonas sp.]|uniref:MBL fold metallo-hydrolase n=1 Tax=uncultured Arenimonas sp. TaxID=546226 RepID=UPI0030D7F193